MAFYDILQGRRGGKWQLPLKSAFSGNPTTAASTKQVGVASGIGTSDDY